MFTFQATQFYENIIKKQTLGGYGKHILKFHFQSVTLLRSTEFCIL